MAGMRHHDYDLGIHENDLFNGLMSAHTQRISSSQNKSHMPIKLPVRVLFHQQLFRQRPNLLVLSMLLNRKLLCVSLPLVCLSNSTSSSLLGGRGLN